MDPALLPLMRTLRLPVVDWIDAPADLNGLVPYAEKTKSGFCACVITFQTQSTDTLSLSLSLSRSLSKRHRSASTHAHTHTQFILEK